MAREKGNLKKAGQGFARGGFFFFQAEDGIRDDLVTGVQTCALPICTTLTVPFPTNATSLSGPLPGLSAGAVTVQVYNQTGASTYLLVGGVPLTVTDRKSVV